MNKRLSAVLAVMLGMTNPLWAAPQSTLPTADLADSGTAPVHDVVRAFTQIAPPPGSMTLSGTRPDGQIEFGVRSDELVTQARLTLHYRPSPALTPTLSQLKIYLNDELVNLVTVTPDQSGQENTLDLDLDPRDRKSVV